MPYNSFHCLPAEQELVAEQEFVGQGLAELEPAEQALAVQELADAVQELVDVAQELAVEHLLVAESTQYIFHEQCFSSLRYNLTNSLHGLWNLEVQCRIHKALQ